MPGWNKSSIIYQLCIYYYADVVPAVVSKIQDEDGLIYTEEMTKNKKVTS